MVEPQIAQILGRLRVGYRRQDCQIWKGWCGALPHAPAGRSSPCTPGTSCGRAQEATENQASKLPSFQTSTSD